MGSWQGRDGCRVSRRREKCENAEQVFGVGDSIGRCPIRLENFFFDPRAVKIAVGKSVDGKHVGIRLGQPIAELRKMIAREQFGGGASGEAQADGEGYLICE